MASTVAQTLVEAPEQTSVKALVQTSSIPSAYYTHHETTGSIPEKDLIPIIDFSLLTSSDPDQQSRAIQDLGRACEDWGFFMLVNHGIPESLMKELVEGCQQFFDLPEEEKKEYLGTAMKDVWAPIRYSSGVDSNLHKAVCWRDFLKIFAHPTFNFPTVLPAFREVARDYNKRTRAVATELLKGISKHMGLEENYLQKSMEFDSGFQVFATNLYPPCPQPDLAMGIPSHTDHGLITILIQNGVAGLEIKHNEEWFKVDPVPNCVLVNTADHLEILSNGKYKSVYHRATVNGTTPRISIAVAHGPPLEKVVGPAPEFVDGESRPPVYKAMLYKEYMELQQQGKAGLDATRLTQAA